MFLCTLQLDSYIDIENKKFITVGKYPYDPGFQIGEEMDLYLEKRNEEGTPQGYKQEILKVKVMKIEKKIYSCTHKIVIKQIIENLKLENILSTDNTSITGLLHKIIYLEAEDRDFMLKQSDKLKKFYFREE